MTATSSVPLCNGAGGYILKSTPPAKLLEQIQEAVAGGAPMSLEIAAKVIRMFQSVAPPPDVDYRLTAQETRCWQLLAQGHGYQEPDPPSASPSTRCATTSAPIYEKLEVHSKSEAVAKGDPSPPAVTVGPRVGTQTSFLSASSARGVPHGSILPRSARIGVSVKRESPARSDPGNGQGPTSVMLDTAQGPHSGRAMSLGSKGVTK